MALNDPLKIAKRSHCLCCGSSVQRHWSRHECKNRRVMDNVARVVRALASGAGVQAWMTTSSSYGDGNEGTITATLVSALLGIEVTPEQNRIAVTTTLQPTNALVAVGRVMTPAPVEHRFADNTLAFTYETWLPERDEVERVVRFPKNAIVKALSSIRLSPFNRTFFFESPTTAVFKTRAGTGKKEISAFLKEVVEFLVSKIDEQLDSFHQNPVDSGFWAHYTSLLTTDEAELKLACDSIHRVVSNESAAV